MTIVKNPVNKKRPKNLPLLFSAKKLAVFIYWQKIRRFYILAK